MGIEAVILIGINVVYRIIPHIPNATPIAAATLVAAAYLPKKISWLIPLGSLIISDALLGGHTTWLWVYGSYLLTWGWGLVLRQRITPTRLGLVTTGQAIGFFILTNFGVWLEGWYPQTWAGLGSCYAMAIPFFRNTLIGDWVFTAGYFAVAGLAAKGFTNRVEKISENR